MKRWVDETDDAFERVLLRSARGDRAPEGSTERAASALAASGLTSAGRPATSGGPRVEGERATGGGPRVEGERATSGEGRAASGATGVAGGAGVMAARGAGGAGAVAKGAAALGRGTGVAPLIKGAAAGAGVVAWKWLGIGLVLGGATTAGAMHWVESKSGRDRTTTATVVEMPATRTRGQESSGEVEGRVDRRAREGASEGSLASAARSGSVSSPPMPGGADAVSSLGREALAPKPSAVGAATHERAAGGASTGVTGDTDKGEQGVGAGDARAAKAGVATPIPTASTVATPSASALAAAPQASASAPALDASTLAAEASDVDRARRALAAGDAPTSVREVERYEAAYPHGVLTPDAEVVAIEAYAAMGGWSEVGRRGTLFLERFPRDPHAGRVRRLLASRR